ncbi:MAG: hypothetical protein ACK55Z_25300, partial [bacterium]
TNDVRLASSSSASQNEAGTTVSTRLGVRELVDGTFALASRMAFRLADRGLRGGGIRGWCEE